jgi:hypothetical protein
MTPNEICAYLKLAFPELVAAQRFNPDGWSFFDGAPQRGAASNRIIRAVRNGPNSLTRLKLAVSSRQGCEVELEFTSTEPELHKLVEEELKRQRKF